MNAGAPISTPNPEVDPSVAWIISTGKRGHEVKGIGLAEALGLEPVVKQVTLGFPWSLLAPRGPAPRAPALAGPPWPAVVFASGRRTIPFAQAMRRRVGGASLIVALDDPGIPPDRFDFVWASRHDPVTGPNVLKTLTAPHRLTAERIVQEGRALKARLGDLAYTADAPLVGVMLGGPSKAYHFGVDEAVALGETLAHLQRRDGARIIVTASRRTPPEALAALADYLDPERARVFDGGGDNPYPGLLHLATHLVVTCDSVNMLGEAAFTGRPVYAVRLPGRAGKFDSFHSGMVAHGAMRWFEDRLEDWSYEPLDSTTEIAAAIRARLGRTP
ncbi:mitochondrial fission ELM1 family protein [Ancylobacter terrae]|uniref:mitochondrial fission ELM1 family protein n=1 Tax=Ancylobacter sp. sgz301288 TaxID=3342077 RepID=UPI00385F9B3C